MMALPTLLDGKDMRVTRRELPFRQMTTRSVKALPDYNIREVLSKYALQNALVVALECAQM